MVKNILEIGSPYYISDEIVGVVISIDSYIDGCKKNLALCLYPEEGEMNWYEAKELEKGNQGWRMPTKEEFAIMFANIEIINEALKNNGGCCICGCYWTSSEREKINAWYANFYSGYCLVFGSKRYTDCCVRMVLDI